MEKLTEKEQLNMIMDYYNFNNYEEIFNLLDESGDKISLEKII